VLLGIPEDIGVRANYGNAGTSKAWEASLGSLLNIQQNHLTNAENVILLGEIDSETQMKQAEEISKEENHYAEELGELVTQIDNKVSEVIKAIVEAGKFPIIIGGGHNNSFGNLKGTSEALQKPINCINFDAHTDFRALEHRHSGNGFSYAFVDGFLKKYFIFGLHRNYTSVAVFNSMEKNSHRVNFNLFEDISVKHKLTFSEGLKDAKNFCCNENFGIELDMDAIEFMGSSAITPSGFTLTEARQFVSYFSKIENAKYLHICEGSPLAGVFTNQVGKAITYLISDVIS
jgi:formiminoglutamase